MQRLARILSLLSAVVFFTSCAYGATITGSVKGPDGAPFKGAFVQAQNTKTKITVNVLSQKDGRYRFDDLPSGDYDLRIRVIGYSADPRTGITLAGNQSASFDWALQKGTVRWRDLSLYQGEKLIPNTGQGNDFWSYFQLPGCALSNLSWVSDTDGLRQPRCRGSKRSRGIHAIQDAFSAREHGQR